MAVQSANFWQFVKRAFTGNAAPQPNIRQVLISERDTYTLPRRTQQIRVLSGGAWVSVEAEDMILNKGETLTLRADREGVIVTALSRKALQLELRAN